MAFFQSILKTSHRVSRCVPKPIPFSSSRATPPDDELVSTAISILRHQRSKSRWSNLRSLLIPNNVLSASQFSQIALQLRNKPHIVLSFFRFTIHFSLTSHSLTSYATVIHILCRSRLRYDALTVTKSAMCAFSEPIAILDSLIATYIVCDSAPFVFDMLVDACLESKKIDTAIEIYTILKSKNVLLKTRTCNSLLEVVSRSRGCSAGYDLYKEIFCQDFDKGVIPNTITMNVVMVGFYKEGIVKKVEEMWEEMLKIGCMPNLYSYNLLMATYCDANRIGDAMRVFDEIENKGLRHDVVSFNTVIGGFCGIGEVERAEELYRDMVTKGLESTCITLEHLINGYCKIGDSSSAILIYKDMCRRGFHPASSTVNAIIELLCLKNECLAALEFLKSGVKKHSLALEKGNYKYLLKGLCKVGKMEEALEVQAEMVGNGFKPDIEICNAFIDGYIKQGNETVAEKLRKEMMLCK